MVGYNALNLNFTAGGAIAVGDFVKLSADNTVVVSTTSDASIGVANSVATASGEVVTIQVDGVAKVLAGAAITVGDLVEVGAVAGKVTSYTDTVTYVQNERNAIVGRAIKAAAADGDSIEILLQ